MDSQEHLNNPHHTLYVLDADGRSVLRPRIVFIMAVACGVSVANLYWSQPLLDTLANAFHTGTATAGLIVTFTQIGYAAGLVFIVPLGDLLERKRLIVSISILVFISLVIAAVSPSIHFFMAASLVVGVTSVVVQILVPFAATLAMDHERGKVVGQVMSGTLLGILFARTLAGIISELLGWRAVFGFAAILILGLTFVLASYLPRYKHSLDMSYPELLSSVGHLVKTERVLRIRAVYGALVFADFSVLWTSLTFLLAGAPYHFSDAVIGLFGLVGAAGAMTATIAGRLADKGLANKTTITLLSLNLISFVLMIPGTTHLLPVVIGILLLDAGVQGTHITNQSEIYRLKPEARSRLTTAYMTSYFSGGAVGSATSAAIYSSHGWVGVCVLGLIYAAAAVVFWAIEQINSRRSRTERKRVPV
jgi:predicted MFS family arabinose efflux permease